MVSPSFLEDLQDAFQSLAWEYAGIAVHGRIRA